ncbi:ComF family protein [Streptomyces sp. NPDC090106]|uniref:ComF family protein n=1 Tax=Streptomyces sp. NPDC090106 TaxID=3365946 RepID=UPI0038164EA8
MRGWWRDLAELVLPAECGGCGRPRTVLCPGCRAVLAGTAVSRVRPVREPAGLPAVYAAARYGEAVRAVLLAHKERGALALSAPLGEALAASVRAGLRDSRPEGREDARSEGREASQRAVQGSAGLSEGRAVLLVPVPSARAAVAARGHDPARRIALAAAGELRRTGIPARVLAVLRQRRAVADQAGLNSRERLANLAGALAVVPGGDRLLLEGPVVLVDDLMTTGASLAEAARAVRAGTSGLIAGAGETSRGIDAYGRAVPPVYEAPVREGREERWTSTGERRDEPVPNRGPNRVRSRARERDAGARGPRRPGTARAGDIVCAAVVAATPDAFEINRN